MKKLITICLAVVTMILAIGSTALADLSWQTTPILGTSTYIFDNTLLGCSDVIVVTGAVPVSIPHYSIAGDPLFGIGSPSMTEFTIGQTIDAGSGINVVDGDTYRWSVVYTGPGRTITWEDNYFADSGENFVMNYLDPVSTLTTADLGKWNYTETWTDISMMTGMFFAAPPSISYSVDFLVIPEPATICMLGFGALSLIRRKK